MIERPKKPPRRHAYYNSSRQTGLRGSETHLRRVDAFYKSLGTLTTVQFISLELLALEGLHMLHGRHVLSLENLTYYSQHGLLQFQRSSFDQGATKSQTPFIFSFNHYALHF